MRAVVGNWSSGMIPNRLFTQMNTNNEVRNGRNGRPAGPITSSTTPLRTRSTIPSAYALDTDRHEPCVPERHEEEAADDDRRQQHQHRDLLHAVVAGAQSRLRVARVLEDLGAGAWKPSGGVVSSARMPNISMPPSTGLSGGERGVRPYRRWVGGDLERAAQPAAHELRLVGEEHEGRGNDREPERER